MIELASAAVLLMQDPFTNHSSVGTQAAVLSCMRVLNPDETMPQVQSEVIDIARHVHSECETAVAVLQDDDWEGPCKRLLSRITGSLEAEIEVLEGLRQPEDVPSVLYQGWQGDGARCVQISGMDLVEP